MKSLRCIYLPLLAVFAWSSAVAQDASPAQPGQSEAMVRGLYEQVVARHPLGIPHGEDMQVFAPYISQTLLHRFEVNTACDADWFRQHPDPGLKPPGVFETGIFSGGNEEASPQAFYIEKTELEAEGAARVHVKLTRDDAPNEKLIWHVAVIVVSEDGRPVVDDVLFLPDNDGESETRLSEWLAHGCDGPRWAPD